MASGFGKFDVLCRTVPSYPHCNLFMRQLLDEGVISLDLRTAGVGINPTCAIPRLVDGNLGNIANIVVCGVSVLAIFGLIYWIHLRPAAVGRIEFRTFLFLYALTQTFQLLTTGSIFQQGSTGLVVITAIHLGLVAALFWTLMANAVVSLQLVEDGTMASLVPFYSFTVAFFGVTTYISLDTAYTWTGAFGPSNPPESLKNITLFALTSIWPLVAAFVYFAVITHVVTKGLREHWPMLYFAGSAILFVLSQLAYMLLSKIICRASDAKVDGSCVATFLETAAVVVLYFGWMSITQGSWEDAYNDDNGYEDY